MTNKIYTCTFQGLNVDLVEVEAEVSNGLPKFTIVGLGDAAVQESKERIRASIKNIGFKFPSIRKTVNLAPAQIRKQGSHFDLPIALSILCASKQLKLDKFKNSLFLGELALDGELRPITGVLPITDFAKKHGFKHIFLAKKNVNEASIIKGIDIIGVDSLKDCIDVIQSKKVYSYSRKFSYEDIKNKSIENTKVFDGIIGLDKAKRAIQIAAAGFHNIIFMGSPGCGKTLLLREFKKILPPLSLEQSIETSKIYSVAGLLDEKKFLITSAPFREVHHSATIASVVGGGGRFPIPGEISLAHNGVLFFDEILQFPASLLESLRQPLEDRKIRISRINFNYVYPAKFIFAAALNPCPCGFSLDKDKKCRCSSSQIAKYQRKLSGPILDRFDLFSTVEKAKMEKIFTKVQSENKSFNINIAKIHKIQMQRNSKMNSEMTLSDIKKHGKLTKSAEKLLIKAQENEMFSNRAFLKILKVSRTIADIDNSETVDDEHLLEALHFRLLEDKNN